MVMMDRISGSLNDGIQKDCRFEGPGVQLKQYFGIRSCGFIILIILKIL